MAEGYSSKRKTESKDEKPGPPAKKAFGHWSQGLLASMDDPELKVDSDDKVVIIKDKYPKVHHCRNHAPGMYLFRAPGILAT